MLNRAPLVLMILDGFGYSEQTAHNSIKKAPTPQWDTWWQTAPHTLLKASGDVVGLPKTQMGNSEVGHMHIGAGRIIPQDFTRINQAIEAEAFQTNPVFTDAIHALKNTQNTLHVFGLLSPGGVHSHEAHLFAFLETCKALQFERVLLHLFLDGRDTPPKSALPSIHRLNKHLKNTPGIHIQSISGRFYAMDRDHRWERIQAVYDMMTNTDAAHAFGTAEEAIAAYYDQDITDEFIPPTCIGTPHPIQTSDAVFFFNFRADRARELTQAFIADTFDGFQRKAHPKLSRFISMTRYADNLHTTPAFPPFIPKATLGEVLSRHGLRQLRIAETEKYAHVTFFLNGGLEAPFPGEDRTLIPSPKVATYNLQPEMSAPKVTEAILHAIHHQTHDVIICNYANADMVGHTGDFEATCKAITALDDAMHTIGDALKTVQGQLLITADHGNAECMFDPSTNQAHTAHTTNFVPLIYVGEPGWHFNPSMTPSLVDLAPTVLTLLGIPLPPEMNGKSCLTRDTVS